MQQLGKPTHLPKKRKKNRSLPSTPSPIPFKHASDLHPLTEMSGAAAGASTPSSHSSFLHGFASLGLGYVVAIVLGALVVFAALLLVSYLCLRSYTHFRRSNSNPNNNPNNALEGVVLPRIIFVAEDDTDDGGHGPVPGLDPAAISSYPKFPYSRSGAGAGVGGDAACAICLCEYREGEMLRMMPDCRHSFHLMCIDAWLRLNASCPVCRTSPMPTPISTPLSELVPLSQFPAGRRQR